MCNEWCLTWKKVALFWGVIVAISVAYFAITLNSGDGLIDRIGVLTFSILTALLLQGFYLQFFFNEFSSKKRTQALLLLPASRNETFWAKFLLGAIAYLVISVFFIWALLGVSEILNEWTWNTGLSEIQSETLFRDRQCLQTDMMPTLFALALLLVWLFSVAAVLMGLLTFKKNAVLKSFVSWAAVIVILGYFICTVHFLFTGHFPNFAFFGVIGFDGAGFMLFNMYRNLFIGVYIFIIIALIAIARVKYNEKTI
jgi:hypothetical protein